ncbi:MAG: class I SAM-dependent methyltransferase [Blastochloris sp.]|nr:class I SAM-dependent methyltransferase [Blastochloris sp.]
MHDKMITMERVVHMNKHVIQSYNEVAQIYDRARESEPGYPIQFVDAAVATFGIGRSGKILEIGSGTGKATVPFAERGFSMLCLEPGSNLAAVAADKLRRYSNVTMEVVAFEDWELQPQQFDLVLSAGVFHRLSAETAYFKAAQALKESGWIALSWTEEVDSEAPIYQELDNAYQTYAPTIVAKMRRTLYGSRIRQHADQIVQSGCFKDPVIHQVPWSAHYNEQQYLNLLDTFVDIHTLSQPEKQVLFQNIATILRQHGGITQSYGAVLYLAQKK